MSNVVAFLTAKAAAEVPLIVMESKFLGARFALVRVSLTLLLQSQWVGLWNNSAGGDGLRLARIQLHQSQLNNERERRNNEMSGRSPNPNSRNRSMRILSQILFLLVFIALIKMKRPMNWMIVFLGSTVLAALFARFYCGWICPINSVMQVSEWIGKKAKVQKTRSLLSSVQACLHTEC